MDRNGEGNRGMCDGVFFFTKKSSFIIVCIFHFYHSNLLIYFFNLFLIPFVLCAFVACSGGTNLCSKGILRW